MNIVTANKQALTKFNEKLGDMCESINTCSKKLYIMGDFNIDLLKNESCPLTSEFVDTVYSHSLLPCITRPTRVTSRTATLIDNILCSLSENNHNSFQGIMCTDISDHYPIFYIEPSAKTVMTNQTAFRRDMSRSNITKFKDKLKRFDWRTVLGQTHAEAAFNFFL